MPRRTTGGPSARGGPGGSPDPTGARWSLGGTERAIADRLAAWAASDAVARIWRKDPTFWPQAPAADVGSRLGWLRAPEQGMARVDELRAFAEEARADGVEHVVLFGMGGSSLAAEVIARTLPRSRGAPDLTVLDSTHPKAVADVAARVPLERALFVVSSKSGTTLEPNAFFRFFWERAQHAAGPPGRRFVAITDPGTPLERLAKQRGFRASFAAPPDVGGRYSALTVFGLVPATLVGADVPGLLGAARAMVARCADPAQADRNPGLRLGAALGELARSGRDKVVFVASRSVRSFPAWAEQLVAESLGKRGRGIVPVVASPEVRTLPGGPDTVLVHLSVAGEEDPSLEAGLSSLAGSGVPTLGFHLASPLDLGREFFRWELAIAVCGAVLEVDPFDQPDVEHAKELARAAMDRPAAKGPAEYGIRPGPATAAPLQHWLTLVRPRDYVGVQAFLAPTEETSAGLQRLAERLQARLGTVVTVGYGPRFLHSTGQLHKGGPPTGAFLQLVDEPTADLSVPELGLTFGTIVRAQAGGDRGALLEKQRRLVVVNVGPETLAGLDALCRLIPETARGTVAEA